MKYNILFQSLLTSGMQAWKQPPKEKRKESALRDKEREGSNKGKEGFYKKNYKFLLSLQSGQGVV